MTAIRSATVIESVVGVTFQELARLNQVPLHWFLAFYFVLAAIIACDAYSGAVTAIIFIVVKHGVVVVVVIKHHLCVVGFEAKIVGVAHQPGAVHGAMGVLEFNFAGAAKAILQRTGQCATQADDFVVGGVAAVIRFFGGETQRASGWLCFTDGGPAEQAKRGEFAGDGTAHGVDGFER